MLTRNGRIPACLLTILATAIAIAQDMELKELTPSGGLFLAEGISGDGKTVFGEGSLDLTHHGPMIWSKEHGFKLIACNYGRVVASSLDGNTLTGSTAYEGHVYIWNRNSGLQVLPLPPGYEGDIMNSWGISADGKVVAGYIATPSFSNVSPFIWSAATGVQVLNLEGEAFSVSDDGSKVAGFCQTGPQANPTESPFLWTESGGVTILPSPGNDAYGTLLSPDGGTIYGYVDVGIPNSYAFRWTPQNGYESLQPQWPTDPDQASQALDVFTHNSGGLYGEAWSKYGPLVFTWYLQALGRKDPLYASFTGVARDGIHFSVSGNIDPINQKLSKSYLATIRHIVPMVRPRTNFLRRGGRVSYSAMIPFYEALAAGVNPKLEIIDPPHHAQSFTASADGSMWYVPDPIFSGIDSFTYRFIATDGEKTNQATHRFYVNPEIKSVNFSESTITNTKNEQPEILTIDFDGPIGTREGIYGYGQSLDLQIDQLPLEFDHAVTELKIPVKHGDPPSALSSSLTVMYEDTPYVVPVVIDPPQIISLSVTGPQSASPTGRLRISNNELSDKVMVHLTSSSPAVVVPSTIQTVAGSTYASFPITISPVSKQTEVEITATAGNGFASCVLYLKP